ncbi:MFS general substrate transporter [Suillus spraguei]|nr:MFS general substrate transporter [Suillus spraguei]
MTTMAGPSSPVKEAKEAPGASWKKNEEHIVPKNRIGIVFFGLMCCVFLAALDQTIVATALPTIVADLGGGNEYSWVGSAYMLACASLGPLYAKLSDISGRKPILYALCGAAQNMTWLIVCRAVQGIGGGGIIQLVQITISDIVSLQDRGNVVGPLIGGVFTDHVTWRWCFWVNLPTGGVAGAVLFFFLNLNPHEGRPFRDHIREFDFVGLFLIITGVICLLVGFDSSETTWQSAETIALLVVGGALLILGGVNEIYTSGELSRTLFTLSLNVCQTRTTGAILISVFLHAVVFFSGKHVTYLPMYYQVLGASATGSGIRMLPYSLCSALMSVFSGIVVARTGSYRPMVWFGWIVMTLGWGLMIMLDNTSTTAEKEVYPFIAGLGIGCLFQTPLIGLQAAMPLKDMATSTGAFVFLRTLGGTVGITIGEAIISSVLQLKLRGIQGLTINTSPAALNDSIRQISSIANPTVRSEVMHAYSQSISTIWLVNTPLAGFGLFLVLFIRGYTLQRTIIRSGEKKPGDVEKGAAQATIEEDSPVMELASLENEKRRASCDDATEHTRTYTADDVTSVKQKTEE